MNDIQALRGHLFNTLQALQDKENPMDIDRAKAVCQVGTVIIDSAKAEIDFARVNGSVDTNFFQKLTHAPTAAAQLENKNQEPNHQSVIEHQQNNVSKFETKNGNVTVNGAVTTHKLK